jgi:Zn-dependent M16 (insulinase) family peptidase
LNPFFEVIDDKLVKEIESRAIRYRHKTTGAEVLSLINTDENKVFGITFRTPAPDSTGLPHILEHSVLAGSRKYPVKEPFIELVKGSLKTFLNAGTFPDRTSYPCASQNLADFYNLIDVYLDAVFYPLLLPRILDQEGWHYELESVEGPIRYKGVVYNEMKGAYSDPQNYLGRLVRKSLFPDTAYRNDSGGDPEEITGLTYEVFQKYHETYYHPTNALIFFSGDDPPERRLDLLQDYLKDFAPGDIASPVAVQKSFATPRKVEGRYPVRDGLDGEAKYYVALTWLLPENNDLVQNLSFQVLEHALLGTPGSPLRKAMIDSGLGEDLVSSGLADYLRQMFFGAGLKGVSASNVDRVEPMILEALGRIASAGIEPRAIEAAMNTLEFHLRERNSGGYPRGLVLMYQSLSGWIYGWDPIARLAYQDPLNSLKTCLEKDSFYLERLVKTTLLDNPHRLTVQLEPDSALQAELLEREESRLARFHASLSRQELDDLLLQTSNLKQIQETPDSHEALATIPTLKLEDLERDNQLIPLELAEIAGVEILTHDLFTDGIVYLDLAFDLRNLPREDLPLVPLFRRALLEMGTQVEDFVSLSQRIGQHTGGIWTQLFTSEVQGESEGVGWLILRAKSVIQKSPELFGILEDILLRPNFEDRERFRQILLEEKASKEAAMLRAGREIVDSRLRSRFSDASWARERMTGVDYLFFLRDLVEKFDTGRDAISAGLDRVRTRLLNRAVIKANLTLPEVESPPVKNRLAVLLKNIPSQNRLNSAWPKSEESQAEGWVIPTQVNYVGKGADLYELGYRYDGSIHAILNFLRTTWLWDRVRIQGGAYSASASFGRQSGVLTLASYRDPNLFGTLDNFDRSAEYLRTAEISADEIRKSIIGAIGAIDAYRLPDAKGYTSFVRHLIRETDEARQAMRDQVLSTALSDFREFAEVLEGFRDSGQIAVVGSAEAFERAHEYRPDFFKLLDLI